MSSAEVFIIESLDFKDEKDQIFEGKFLSQILHFAGKRPLYYYIRTKHELKRILRLFKDSGYRYLHLSCHGNSASIYTTLDRIPFQELGKIMNPYLEDKRLFVSACSVVNEDLARAIIPSSGCYSIIGPIKDVFFGDAAIVWASFYHLMFGLDDRKMKRSQILPTLRKLVRTFEVSLDYYSTSEQSATGYKKTTIRPQAH